MEAKKLTLRQRLSAAMGEIGYLQKDGRNKEQRYSFLSERKVKQAAQAAFVKHGLVPEWDMRIEKVERAEYNGKNGMDAVVRAEVLFRSDTDSVFCSGVGQGRDPGDKALMKAQTAAVRECLKNLFLIASGDDPESADPEGDAHPQEKPAATVYKKDVLDKIKLVSTKEQLEQLKMNLPVWVDGMDKATVDAIRAVYKTKAAEIAAATEKVA